MDLPLYLESLRDCPRRYAKIYEENGVIKGVFTAKKTVVNGKLTNEKPIFQESKSLNKDTVLSVINKFIKDGKGRIVKECEVVLIEGFDELI